MIDFLSRKKGFGLEISDFSLKALWLKKKGGAFVVAGHSRLNIPKGTVVEGVIKEPGKLATLITQTLATASPQKITSQNVVTSLPENQTFVSVIEVPKMTKKEMDEAVQWEAEHYIPYPIKDMYLDWQPIAEQGSKTRLLLAAARRDVVDGYIATLEMAKLKLQALDLEAAAEGRALIVDKPDSKKIHLLVDIGATKTTFSILSADTILFSSSITKVSGNYFTKTIADCLSMKKEDAEKIKVACCSPNITAKEKTILDAIHPAFDELAREINKIRNYFLAKQLTLDQNQINIIICGGGAGLFGIAPYLSLKIKQKVHLGDPWTNISFQQNPKISLGRALSYSHVIGLALRGANLKLYSHSAE